MFIRDERRGVVVHVRVRVVILGTFLARCPGGDDRELDVRLAAIAPDAPPRVRHARTASSRATRSDDTVPTQTQESRSVTGK